MKVLLINDEELAHLRMLTRAAQKNDVEVEGLLNRLKALEYKPAPPGLLVVAETDASNCQLFYDGKPLEGVQRVVITIEALQPIRINVEFCDNALAVVGDDPIVSEEQLRRLAELRGYVLVCGNAAPVEQKGGVDA